MAFAKVDLVVYINLNNRVDRREEMEAEFQRVAAPKEKILRWPATRLVNTPALGCTLSHIAVLEHVASLDDKIQNVLVLEDDFNFIDDIELVSASLSQFLSNPPANWEIALLAYVVTEKIPHDDLVSISLFSFGTAGYLVKRAAIPRLIDNFKEGAEHLKMGAKVTDFSLDVHWSKFMAMKTTFFFNKPLGYQRASYSNITGDLKKSESYVR